MPEQAVDPDAKYLIQIALQFAWCPLPVRSYSGGALGGKVSFAVHMGGAGALLDMDSPCLGNPVGIGSRPEFTHGDVVSSQRLQCLKRCCMRAAGL